MVESAAQRAFGPHLRHFLGRALGNRGRAFLAKLGVRRSYQSSTATGLMAMSLCCREAGWSGAALAVMLGANVGATLVVQLLI
jgi:phosphate:Na+ symporter